MATMPTRPSLRVIKSFSYRGATKHFSNRYFLDGGTPATAGAWTTISDAVVTAEKAVYGSWVTIIEVDGYEAGSDVPVHIKTYSTVGTLSDAGLPRATGDSAALVRYATADRSAKNHPIYLFNYYHGAYSNGTTQQDALSTPQKTALETYGGAWVTGFSDGSQTLKRCGPFGHVALGVVVNSQLHHRDFPGG